MVINPLQIEAVCRRDLLLDLEGERELVEIVIWPMPVLRTIGLLQGIAAVRLKAELGCVLQPVAVAEIFRARNQAKAVALEEF